MPGELRFLRLVLSEEVGPGVGLDVFRGHEAQFATVVFGQGNITSHTYDEAKARDVFEAIPAFLAEAQYVLRELQRRITAE